MSSFGGDHARAEGCDSLLLVLRASASLGRLDVCFLARLTRSFGNSRVSSAHGPTPSPILSIAITSIPLLRRLRLSVYPNAAKTAGLTPCFLRSLFAYLLDYIDFNPALTWTHVFAPSNLRYDIARALKTDVDLEVLSAHGR